MKQLHIFTIFATPHSFFDGQFRYLADMPESRNLETEELRNEIILVCSSAEGAQEFAERNHIRFVPVEMPRALSPGAILRAIKQIRAIIRQEKPDAVFGHTPVGALCAMIAARWCGVRNRVYYRHGLIYTTMKGVKRFVFKTEEQFVSFLATDIVNVSHSLSKLAMADHLNPNSKQHVIGHGTCGGIDAVNRFNPTRFSQEQVAELKRSLGLDAADIVYGFCGRICKDKGTIELVEGFEKFKKLHPDVAAKLLLIGHYDERDILPQHVMDTIKNDKDIVVTGAIDPREVPIYYLLLDVFVFPSHREGFGMVAIEASAMEKPLLVSKVHGCEDTIVEHVTGEYIQLTPESICHGMEIMMDDSARRVLGKNGRQKVLEWYDFRVMWPLVSELYKKIIK